MSSKVTDASDSTLVFEFLVNFFTEHYKDRVTVLGAHSFLYKDDRDTIIVYVNNGQMAIMLDGSIDEVRSVFSISPIYPVDSTLATWEQDFVFRSTYVQPILALL